MAKKQKREAATKITKTTEPEPELLKRCRLCSDGGRGKRLVPVINSFGDKEMACMGHAGFFGADRQIDRRWLPGSKPEAGVTEVVDDTVSKPMKLKDY